MKTNWRFTSAFGLLSVSAWLLLSTPSAVLSASNPKSFYEGKTIRLVVGYSPGGGFDLWSRMIARHITRHIPGKPSIIVQNMPGAASLVAANWAYAGQPGDGLTLVNFHGAHVVNAVVGIPEAKFDPQKFLWIGSPSPGFRPYVLYIRPEIAKSLDQFLNAPKPVNLGATGRGTGPFQLATFLEVSGANVRVVGGYPGTSDVYAAIERKEVDGIFQAQESGETTYKRYISDGIVAPLFKFGQDNPGLPSLNVPDFSELAKKLKLGEELKILANFLMSSHDLARLYAVPPGTAPDRVEILRKAFHDVLRDPRFLEEANKMGAVPVPVAASELEKLVASMIKTPQSVKDLYKKLFL